MFRLNGTEVEQLNRSQFATGSQRHRDPRFPPYAFTEHGALMLASVLNSQVAIQASIVVVRAFVRLREMLATHKELAAELAEVKRTQRKQGAHIAAIFQILDRLLEPPPEPKRRIGFAPAEKG
jgi:hypothetical protein